MGLKDKATTTKIREPHPRFGNFLETETKKVSITGTSQDRNTDTQQSNDLGNAAKYTNTTNNPIGTYAHREMSIDNA